MYQRFHHRDRGGLARFLVDDVKDVAHRATGGFRLRPAGEPFGEGIEARHPPFGIGRDHGVADGVERYGKLFLAVQKCDVGLLQPCIRFRLDVEQMPCFQMNLTLEPILSVPIDQVDESEGEQQGKHTGGNDEGKQYAHVRLEPGVALRQRIVLDLHEAVHLGTNRIHQPLALAAARDRQHAGRVAIAAQLDHLRQFRQLGIHQRGQCLQVPAGGADRGKSTQFLQLAADAIPHRQIRRQEGLVAGQRKAALTGLGIGHCGQQIVCAVDYNQGLLSRARRFLGLPESLDRYPHHQPDQQGGSGKRGNNFAISFQ